MFFKKKNEIRVNDIEIISILKEDFSMSDVLDLINTSIHSYFMIDLCDLNFKKNNKAKVKIQLSFFKNNLLKDLNISILSN